MYVHFLPFNWMGACYMHSFIPYIFYLYIGYIGDLSVLAHEESPNSFLWLYDTPPYFGGGHLRCF